MPVGKRRKAYYFGKNDCLEWHELSSRNMICHLKSSVTKKQSLPFFFFLTVLRLACIQKYLTLNSWSDSNDFFSFTFNLVFGIIRYLVGMGSYGIGSHGCSRQKNFLGGSIQFSTCFVYLFVDSCTTLFSMHVAYSADFHIPCILYVNLFRWMLSKRMDTDLSTF